MNAIKKFKHQQLNNDVIISNLQQLIFNKGISEAELSRQTSIPQPTLHKILSGKTNDPRISTLKVLADYFEISLDSLYSNNVLFKSTTSRTGHAVPIVSWKDCIVPTFTSKNLTPNNWEHWVVVDPLNHKNMYCLTTKPSMEPRFPRGTLIIVDPNIQPEDGDFVIVQYPNVKEATLRELSIDGPTQLLLSLNQNLAPDKLDKSIKIIGTVIQSRFSY